MCQKDEIQPTGSDVILTISVFTRVDFCDPAGVSGVSVPNINKMVQEFWLFLLIICLHPS